MYISINKIVFILQIYISTRKSLQKYSSTNYIVLQCVLRKSYNLKKIFLANLSDRNWREYKSIE